jgi:predicted metal-binding protein
MIRDVIWFSTCEGCEGRRRRRRRGLYLFTDEKE